MGHLLVSQSSPPTPATNKNKDCYQTNTSKCQEALAKQLKLASQKNQFI